MVTAPSSTRRYQAMHLLVLGVVVVLGVVLEPVRCRVQDSDPQRGLDKVIGFIGDHAGVLRAGKVKQPPLGTRGTRDVVCNGCLSAMTFIKTLLLLGTKWDTIRDDVVNICKVIVQTNNWKGDILCPNLIDNMGPLVYNAIKESRKSPKTICIHMNWCDPYNLPAYVNQHKIGWESSVTRSYKRQFHHLLSAKTHSNKELATIQGILKKESLNEAIDIAHGQIQKSQDAIDQLKSKTQQEVVQAAIKVAKLTKDNSVPSLKDLGVDDLPTISKLLNDLQLGGEDFSERFEHYVEKLNSAKSWSKDISMKKLLAQSKLLEKKVQEAMKNLRSKDKLKTDEHRMAQLIANSLTRTFKRVKREVRKRTTELLKVVQVTDIHVEQEYITGAATDCGLPVCCRPESEGPGSAGVWGDAQCNAPPSTIRKLLRSAATHNPDMVVFTGDNPPHTIWLESLEKQLNASRWVASELAATFPNIKVYPNIGNHENFPVNMYAVSRPETQTLNREWAAMFGPAAGFGPEQIATINKAGYYTLLIKPGLRLVAYNTNYGGTGNFLNIVNHDQPEYHEMLTWLESTLEQARQNSEKVFLTGHHEAGMSEIVVAFDETITPMLIEYSDIIMWHPCGHMHRDQFRVVIDPTTGDPVHVTFMAQSMNSYPHINPSYRIYYFDPDTFEPLDYEQYSIDIKKANEDPDSEDIVALGYRASEMYGLADLSPTSMLDLYERLMEDDELFQMYWTTRRDTGIDGVCDVACHDSEQCHIISPTYDVYRACIRYIEGGNQTSYFDSDDTDFMQGFVKKVRSMSAGASSVGFTKSVLLSVATAFVSVIMLVKPENL